MIQKSIFYTSILLIVAFISLGFKPYDSQINQRFDMGSDDEALYIFPSKQNTDYTYLNAPFTGKFFVGYKEAIGFKESQNKYHKVNSLGYMGKYQFGVETLKSIGISDSVHFLNNPRLQEKAFVTLLSRNKFILQSYIEKYEGKVISNIKITESGILAAAHLGGAGSVIKFFKSNGERYLKDQYGTSIRSYLREFAGYETKRIPAIKNARVK
ncbi:peptidoglycan-binding protein LysM [Flavobacterium sp.]